MRQIRALLLSLLWAAPAWAQAPTPECPGPGDETPAQIEVLDFAVEGSTCQGFHNIVSSYGGVCRIQRATYSGPDAIYKVRLNPGHERVTFRLDMEPPADLVLALLRQCGQGASCVSSSPDFIGSRAEEISAASYPPGIYYLVVDSAEDQEGRCGAYRLTVTGVNPTPDLILELTSPPGPVVAGETLTYTMAVTNVGSLEATDVQVIQTLPAQFQLVSASPGCESLERGRLRCRRDRLAVGAPASWPILVKVRVDPATRGVSLRSMATVRALEGDPTPSNNAREVTTAVIARSDLSITMSQSRNSVVAGDGQPLTYTLRIRNAGPSDAVQAVVTYDLPKEASFVSAPEGCGHAGGKVTCTIGRLAATASMEKAITVNVKPSAQELLTSTARVAVLGELNPADNVTTRTTGVIRKTDLSVTMTGPGLAAAGEDLTYAVVVENLGPSDSAGAKVTNDPAQFLCVVQENGCTTTRVTFSTGPIPRGGKKNLSFEAHVDSSLRRTPPQPISNEVKVAPEDPREQDPNRGNDTGAVKTSIEIQADLELVSKTATLVSDLADPDPGPVVVGENLLYTLKVQNNGPSYSNGGMISDTLASSLKYVSSPDDCGEEGRVVSCPVPALPPDDGAHGCGSATPTSCFEARFVVRVLLDSTATIDNRASIEGMNVDPKPANNARSSIPTAVEQRADLVVELSGSPELLTVPGELTYTVTVANAGPSLAIDVLALLELPDGASLAALEPDCKESAAAANAVECNFGDLMAGSIPVARSIRVTIPAVTASRTVTATVHVSSDTPEPDSAAALDNTAEATTTLALVSEADLTIEKSASVAVITGTPLFYTLVVSNRGPAKATGVRVEDHLPVGIFYSGTAACAQREPGSNLVVWTVGDLDKDAERSCTFTVTTSNIGTSLNRAFVTSQGVRDPDPGNNTSQASTVVLPGGGRPPLPPSLVLPYFEVDSKSSGATTHLAVRNPSGTPVCVRYDYVLAGQQEPGGSDLSCIADKAVDTRDLRDLQLGDGQVAIGHVAITPVECSQCDSIPCTGCIRPTALTGDFFRVDSSQGPAGGELLLSRDSTRHPPDLCERWDVRFLNSGSVAGSTEIVFFVSRNAASDIPVATGKVYSEAGDFVQTISVKSSETSFHRTTEDLLASAGAIEWTFRDGVVGNVSAFHREGDNAVAIPGVCRRPPAAQPLGDENPLLLPYFEVDRSSPAGATTLFAVRNGTDREVQVHYEYFSSDDTLQSDESKPLAGHATRTVNLRDIPGPATGFVRITAVPDPAAPERLEQILSGDYIRLAKAPLGSQPDLAAGSALVDTDSQRSPQQLCHRWDVRFIKNARTGRETFFTFFLDEPTSGPVATGKVFRKDGTLLTTISLDAPPGPLVAFEKSAADLGLDSGEGSIEWELGPLGHVATIFKSGGSFGTMLVPGVCRDPQ